MLAAIASPIYPIVFFNDTATTEIYALSLHAALPTFYSAHMGVVPPTLDPLTAVVTNSLNQTAGPFMASLPTPPAGWTTPYVYAGSTAAGTFVISASGDGTTGSLP